MGIGLLSVLTRCDNYFLIIGAIANTLLFLFISIPLAENHQKSRKEGFDQYKKETRMLLPIYKRAKNEK
jgi:steroid 5-alpha reductase family enzyme